MQAAGGWQATRHPRKESFCPREREGFPHPGHPSLRNFDRKATLSEKRQTNKIMKRKPAPHWADKATSLRPQTKKARRGTVGAFGSPRNTPEAQSNWADRTAGRLLSAMQSSNQTAARLAQAALDRVSPGFGRKVALHLAEKFFKKPEPA